MLSVFAFRDERVNTLVDESGVISSCIKLPSSKINSKGTNPLSVPDSNIILSVVISESSSVPAS